MVDELSYLLPGFHGQSGRIRCIAHVLNLIAKVSIGIVLYMSVSDYIYIYQAILSAFTMKSRKSKKNDNTDDEDDDDDDDDDDEKADQEYENAQRALIDELTEDDYDLDDDLNDDDALAPEVAAQDEQDLRDITREAGLSGRVPRLPRSDVRMAAIMLTKVCLRCLDLCSTSHILYF